MNRRRLLAIFGSVPFIGWLGLPKANAYAEDSIIPKPLSVTRWREIGDFHTVRRYCWEAYKTADRLVIHECHRTEYGYITTKTYHWYEREIINDNGDFKWKNPLPVDKYPFPWAWDKSA